MSTQPQEAATNKPNDRAAIGLSFSGGGFRAAAYSLGSMALLQDLGLLGRAKVLSGVSGGSVAIGAYLCCKAGSDAKTETDFNFYKAFYNPFLNYLNQETLAEAFVTLPRLLSGRKLLHAAADSLNNLLEQQLAGDNKNDRQPALLSNQKIARMLNETRLSPDYVFFNTSNITTLDLFRFGLQRSNGIQGSQDKDNAPTYFLNRYYLNPQSHETNAKLHQHAGQIRIADCVASSFAFPIGFEPMIFPDDFFRADNRHSDKRWHPSLQPRSDATNHSHEKPWEAAKAAFAMTPICDHKPYIAFLDGGLYDNLGLASVEDIRRMINKRNASSAGNSNSNGQQTGNNQLEPEGSSNELTSPIRYVIATDVDNIQPGNSNYQDPDLDAALADAPAGASNARPSCLCWPPRRRWRWLGLAGLALAAVLLLANWTTVVASPWLVVAAGSLTGTLLSLALLSLVAVLLLTSRLRAWLRALGLPRNTPNSADPSLAQILGLGPTFQNDNAAIDPGASLASLGTSLLLNADPGRLLSVLRSAIVWRRLSQLIPAFSGYLKRTRTLTYAYLEQTYQAPQTLHAKASGGDSEEPSCVLIRNMIFELTPGPDVDPDPDVSRITVRAVDYAKVRDESAQGPNWATSRKLRRATNLARWMQQSDCVQAPGTDAGKHAMAVWTAHQQLPERDQSAEPAWLEDLQLEGAAAIWLWLHQQLGFDHRQDAQAHLGGNTAGHPEQADSKGLMANTSSPSPQASQSSEAGAVRKPKQGVKCSDWGGPNNLGKGCNKAAEIGKLVQEVRLALHHSMDEAAQQQPGLEQLLRERGRIKLDTNTADASWIPLICEMATNLSTTLWTSGFRWYVFSAAPHAGSQQAGGWYSYRPDARIRAGHLWLDFGAGTAMANKITVLAGYLGMAFNLLEFAYTSLAADQLAAPNRATASGR